MVKDTEKGRMFAVYATIYDLIFRIATCIAVLIVRK